MGDNRSSYLVIWKDVVVDVLMLLLFEIDGLTKAKVLLLLGYLSRDREEHFSFCGLCGLLLMSCTSPIGEELVAWEFFSWI